MSKINYKVFCIFYIVLFVGFLACGDMDETYRHFWEDGEKIYPAPADSLKLYSGRNRIGISWKTFGDPNVSMAKIFWNNRSDSLDVPVQSHGGVDSTYVIIDNLDEGTYSFEIYTYDQKKNRSVLRDGVGTVYGNTYERTLLPRFLQSALFDEGNLTIAWGSLNDESSIGSEIYYKSILGTQNKVFVKNDVPTTTIDDYDFESIQTITYRTVYVPPMSIDTFYTNMQTVVVRGAPIYFLKSGWTATASSFDSRPGASYRPPSNTIDGNPSTIWVNQVSPQTYFPHTLTIDMGEIKNDVAGISIRAQRRNETPKSVDILVSKDGGNWDLMGLYNVENIADIVQNFDFMLPQNVRYFRIVTKEPWGNTNNVVIVEVEAYTYTR